MLEVDKKEAQLLQRAISAWQQDGLVGDEQAQALRKTWKVRGTDWQIITLYIFIAAVSCALMAFGSLVLDEKWIEVMRRRLSLTDGLIATLFAGVTILLCYRGYRRRQPHAGFTFNRELYWLLPVLSAGVSTVYLGKSLHYLDGNYGLFWLLAALVYGALSVTLGSRLLWVATLLCLIPAYVLVTYHVSDNRPYFWGMNLPCRMVLLAVVILALHLGARQQARYQPMQHITWVGGWLLLLLAGWLISIFGNCGSWEEWQQVRQYQLLWWVVMFTALCAGTLWLGIRTHDNMLRDMGVIFLLLDMYTRYFEYLWDRTHKGLFFAILALSFWWLGKLLEKRLRRPNA